MSMIKSGTKFILTDNKIMHCLDGDHKSNSCISNIKKDYPILSLKEANSYLLNDPNIRKCEHCMSIEDIETE